MPAFSRWRFRPEKCDQAFSGQGATGGGGKPRNERNPVALDRLTGKTPFGTIDSGASKHAEREHWPHLIAPLPPIDRLAPFSPWDPESATKDRIKERPMTAIDVWWRARPWRQLVLVAAALITACRDEPSAPPTTAPVVQNVVFRVVVTAPRQSLSPGDSVPLSAQAFDAQGRVLPTAPITWSSSSATVASVDARGMVTAIGVGSAEVTATSGGQSGSATMVVSVTQLCECTKVVDSTVMSLLQRNDTTGTYVFRLASGREPGLVPGNIMVGAQGAGYLRRVRSVTKSADRVTVETDVAYLEEAVIEGAFATTLPTDDLGVSDEPGVARWGPWTTTYMAPGVTMARTGRCCSLDGLTFSLKSDLELVPDAFKFAGDVTIKKGDVDFLPRFEVSSNIQFGQLQRLRTAVRGGIDLNVEAYELKMSVLTTTEYFQAEIVKRNKFFVKQKPFTTFIGPMPVVGIITLTFTFKATPTITASTIFGGHFRTGFGVTAGAEWTRNGGWGRFFSASSHFDANAPEFQGVEGSGSVKFAIVPELSVQFYGIAGPKIELEPYAEAAAAVGASFKDGTPTGIDWEAKVSLGLNLNIGAKLSILGRKDLLEYSFGIPIIKPKKLIRGFSDGPLAIHTRVHGEDGPDSLDVRLRPAFVDTLPITGLRDLSTSTVDARVAVGSGITFREVRSGASYPHRITLPDLPGNCTFGATDGDDDNTEPFVERADTVVVNSKSFIALGAPESSDTLNIDCIPMGALRVRTTTIGEDAPTRHQLFVERKDTVGTGKGRPRLALGTGGIVGVADTVIGGLAPANSMNGATGEYRVQLDPGRRNCAVTKPASQRAMIISGDTALARFQVHCIALGFVTAQTTTTDPDAAFPSDPIAYRLEVRDRDVASTASANSTSSGTSESTMGPSASALVSELVPLFAASGASGKHDVTLRDVPNRCRETSGLTRPVTVFTDDTASADFTLHCVERLHVVTTSTGPGVDADGYLVVVENSDGTADSIAIAPTDTVAIAGVIPGTHTIRLADVDGSCATPASVSRAVSGRDSTLVRFAVQCVGPAAPRSLRATRVESARIDVAWDPAPGVQAAFFRLYRSAGGTTVVRDSLTATIWDDLGLPSYTRFVYRVAAVDANGLEGPKSVALDVRTRDGTAPSAPSAVSATATNATMVALNWTAAVDAESGIRRYRVYRDGTLIDSTTSTSYVSRGLTAVTWYTFHVQAVNGESIVGPMSAPATALTPDGTPPTAPTGLVATAAGTTQIDLAWSAASDPESGISRYRVYRNGVLVDSTTGTTFADTGLTPSTTYTYEITATNGGGVPGPRSAAATATTAAIPVPTGTIVATVRTSGTNVPTSGFQVQVSAGTVSQNQPLAPNGSASFVGLTEQPWTVLLHGLPANCSSVDGVNPRSVTVVAGTTVTTRFVVSCR